MKSRLLGLAVGLLVSACQSTNSENVKTQGIEASFRVTDSATGLAHADATLRIGSTYIDLSGGDELRCDGQKMRRTEGLLNEIYYDAVLARRAVGDAYVFEFRRPGGEVHLSYAMAPEPVVIAVPSNGAVVDSKLPLSVAWSTAAEGSISISISGSGIDDKSYGVGVDRGTYSLPANSLRCDDGYVACTANLTVTRTIVGVPDPDFESNDVQSATSASVSLQITM